MNFVNFARKASMIWFALGLILVGALLGGFGLYVSLRPDDTEYATAEAKISIILTDDTHGSDPTYTVYVNFEDLNGEMHNDVLIGGYSSAWKVGDIIKVKYDVNNPEENVGWDDGKLILYIVMGVGILAFIGGVVLMIRTCKKKVSDYEEFNQVKEEDIDPKKIEEIKNDDSPMRDYYFHYTKNIKQGYVMEDVNHMKVFEAKMVKLTFFKPFIFDFVNGKTGKTKTMKIGHTVSTSVGMGGNFKMAVPIRSAFKIDGVNNWEYIKSRGYGFDVFLKGIRPCFNMYHYGVKVGYIETTGVDPFKYNSDRSIDKIPANGCYKIECRQEDAEDAFMICFSIARAMFNSLNTPD